MLRVPSKIKVGTDDYTVIVVKDLRHHGDKVWGLKKGSDFTIHIEKDMPTPICSGETLLHEVMHALSDYFELGLGDTEERTIASLSKGVMMVLRDNPKLRKYLMESITNGK